MLLGAICLRAGKLKETPKPKWGDRFGHLQLNQKKVTTMVDLCETVHKKYLTEAQGRGSRGNKRSCEHSQSYLPAKISKKILSTLIQSLMYTQWAMYIYRCLAYMCQYCLLICVCYIINTHTDMTWI